MDPNFQHTRTWDIKVTNKYLPSIRLRIYYLSIYLSIKVTQLEAGQHQDFVAPPGCLQYNFGKTLGTVQNFNFKVVWVLFG